MQITCTAQELYARIRSYDIVEFWGNQNEENVSMIIVKTSCVTLTVGEKYRYISVEQHFNSKSDIFCCACNITGNVFSCETEERKRSERLIVTSDCAEAPIVLVLRKIF